MIALLGPRVRLQIPHDCVLAAATILAEFTTDPARGYQAKKKDPGENRGPSS